MAKYIEIQNEVIERYGIRIDTNSRCYGRMHAHVRERRVCKWVQKNSIRCTFDLFHEIGHILTTKSTMRRAESEYFATCWAIDYFKKYGLTIPRGILYVYQTYIYLEVARGKRRGGKDYPEMNLYTYAGVDE